ncbi:hypothetical protein D3C71_1177810 [compost metagenome]
MTLLPLIAREGVGNGGLGGLVSSLGRQVQGGGDLVKAASGDPAVILDNLLQRPDLTLGGAGAHLDPADPLSQHLVSLGTDPRHFGDVGQQGLVISLQLGLEAGYALGQGRLGIAVDGDPLLCRREPFALLGHGGLGGLLLDLPHGGIQGAADLGQALLFAGELRFGDRLGELGIDAIQHLLGLGQPFALGIHHSMIGLGGQGASGGVQFLVDLGKTSLGLVAQRPHHIHFNLAGAGINRENGIAKIAHLTLYTVNLAVQLVLLQDGIDAHLAQVILLIAQQVFCLL